MDMSEHERVGMEMRKCVASRRSPFFDVKVALGLVGSMANPDEPEPDADNVNQCSGVHGFGLGNCEERHCSSR